MEYLGMLGVAVIIDLLMGDPPDAAHPVAWMGRIIAFLEKPGHAMGRNGQFAYGVFVTGVMITFAAIPLFLLFSWLDTWLEPSGGAGTLFIVILGGILLKSTFSIRGLYRTGHKIRALLEAGDSETTRFQLRALVSRNTASLSRSQMVSAATESVAEGLCDSVVAPLFYFLLGGLPGAMAYRAVNTLDSMIGYRGRYEYLGKFAARLDDVLNFIPARLAMLCIVVAAGAVRTGRTAWRIARREHRHTSSPNAGWPMAAMAGALDIRLEKPGHYILGQGTAELKPATITMALRLFAVAAGFWLLLCGIGGGIRFAIAA